MMESVKNRLKWFWKDDRSFKKRFFTAFFVNVSFAFFLLFFTPAEMFIGNISDFGFPFGSMALIMGIASVIYVILATAIMILLKGKVFDAVVTFVFSFTIASYLQGNFMNANFGYLNGQPIEWQEHAKLALFNLAVWAVIMLIPYIVRCFSQNVWSKVLQYGSAFLVVIQAVALVSLLLTADFSVGQGERFISRDGLYSVGDENNVIVFIVDYFDNEYADMIEKEDSEFFTRLHGFTRFTNCTSVYRNTLPSVPYLLTATEWDPMESLWLYPQYSFEKSSFLSDISELNSNVNVYVKSSYIGEAGYEYINNVSEEKPNLDYIGVFRAMENCTLYRTMPIIAKPSFWFYTDDLTEMAINESAETLSGTPYDYDDAKFYSGLKEYGLSVVESDDYDSNFTFIHMFGIHFPYSIDENGELSSNASDRSQGKGVFHIIFDYLDRLNELGLYEDSTIIIMADHGVGVFNEEEVGNAADEGYAYFGKTYEVYENFAPTPVLFVKPAGKGSSDPYTLSTAPVSHTDFHATVIEALGGDGSKYGRTFFDVDENEERTRNFYFRQTVEGTSLERGFEYAIDGWSRDVNNWSPTGRFWNRNWDK